MVVATGEAQTLHRWGRRAAVLVVRQMFSLLLPSPFRQRALLLPLFPLLPGGHRRYRWRLPLGSACLTLCRLLSPEEWVLCGRIFPLTGSGANGTHGTAVDHFPPTARAGPGEHLMIYQGRRRGKFRRVCVLNAHLPMQFPVRLLVCTWGKRKKHITVQARRGGPHGKREETNM